MGWAQRGVVLIKSLFLISRDLLLGIICAAKSGRTLPQLTLILPWQVALHCVFATQRWRSTSLILLFTNVALNIVGYIVLILLYRHSIQVIFNRKIPTYQNLCEPQTHPAIQSFNIHLSMLRPLEILFRFITAPLRVLPDVIVLGEVRCGTTNLCGHLSSLPGCHVPFCPWAHPELDNKESFYFVGHFLGIVDPYFYRMAFPLIFTKWWEEYIKGNDFFTFDGCAQYLSSPSAPYLIAHAYKSSGVAPPVLVVCIRNPVDQTISWWQYENNAMSWGERMGLREWNIDLRSKRYPPRTILKALEYSQSSFVQQAYRDAECLVITKLQSERLHRIRHTILTLPQSAITWPGGQLSIFGKGYKSNIDRYNNVFTAEFGTVTDNKISIERHNQRIGRVHIASLEFQSNRSELKSMLRPILADVLHRRDRRKLRAFSASINRVDQAFCNNIDFSSRRNSNPTTDQSTIVSLDEREVFQNHFKREISEIEILLGRSMGWK